MSPEINRKQSNHHLVWVYPGNLTNLINITPRLETTKELRNLGWNVTLIAAGSTGINNLLGVDFFGIPRPNKYLIRQLVFHTRVCIYLLREWESIDIILFHQMSAPWLFSLKPKRFVSGKRRPLFVMDTRTVPMELISKSTIPDRIRRFFYNPINRIANYLADGQTAITKRMAEGVRIPSHKLWGTWPSGVNLERFSPTQLLRQWPNEGETIQLIYIGYLDHARNIMALCKSVIQANNKGMVFKLSLVGYGRQFEELQEFASHSNNKVRVLHPVPHEQVPELLAKAHVGVLPFPDEFKFQVSSPIKLFEYMGAGLPILATKIVCHTDVIENGNYVFWADEASEEGLLDALTKVWNFRDQLSRMGIEAGIAAEQWTWRKSSEKLKFALEEGINECFEV